ncbi:MAG UNVERIFIED_CONTAM: hypothetical protein LVR29_08440 [Microcystis novacekii LVE1205-3]|jgi:hypothetical protein
MAIPIQNTCRLLAEPLSIAEKTDRSHQLSVTSDQLSVTSYQLPVKSVTSGISYKTNEKRGSVRTINR